MQDKLIDIHCHVLPNIDDGPSKLEESVEMVIGAINQGVKGIIATPHYIPGEIEYTKEDLYKRVQELQTQIDRAGLDCKIYPGMELYLSSSLIAHLDEQRIVPLAGSKYVLVEFPSREVSENLINLLHEIQIRGYQPIIAHPERNSKILEEPAIVNELLQQKALLQVNASSILGKNGKQIRQLCGQFIEQGLVSFIASDGHSLGRRSILLADAYQEAKKMVKPAELQKIFAGNASLIIAGETVQQPTGDYHRSKGGLLGAIKRLIS